MNTANARDGYIVVNYLRELAAAFHSFYNDSKIIEAEYKIASEQILLVKAFVNVASVALNTIGIKPMEKM
ncbi:MAG: hypothetical protein DRP42_00175 [Tenericutes bacterium]|nr:MAG: hypothetical protein DRP42_00175 [Mycoplasmatota bacterium]